ncbi:hypothetical protein ACJW8B_16315 [Plesiomonas shigelloides]|uniref:hypothetical protein n=1 Tax=Plesiomonas shigelloides TaxID=703 RepID=UPI00387F2DF4
MSSDESNRRIKFAYQLNGWSYENGSIQNLKQNARKIVPSEYRTEMDGSLFCPACFRNLNRVPKTKDHFTNGRDAFFSHVRKYKNVKCDLKAIKPEGKRYDNWEEAKRAIDDENLVIINAFLKEKPESKVNQPSIYDETAIEDINGPQSEVAIGRHNGEKFTLPSKITTIAGLCRNFDENLYKFYHLPEHRNAKRLIDLLKSVKNISEENETPGLYYGKIIRTNHLGNHKKPTNIRMTYLENTALGVSDFCIKMQDQEQKAHGIDDNSVGRTVIIYGVISDNGTGLCFKNLGWGEFSLLPEKYNSYLD